MLLTQSTKNETSGKKGRATSLDGILGGQLKQRRILLGLSQERLAEQLGITFQQVQKYENGANRISASRLFEISKALDTPISFFFENTTANQSAQPSYGLSDNDQSAFESADDIMTRKETMELIRVYYSIEDAKLRKDLFKLVRSMADNLKKQNT